MSSGTELNWYGYTQINIQRKWNITIIKNILPLRRIALDGPAQVVVIRIRLHIYDDTNQSLDISSKYTREPRIIDNALHPSTGSLIMRLLFSRNFHHLPSDIRIQKRPPCKLHRCDGVKQCRAQIIECSTWKVNLCHTCYNV